MCLLNNFTLFSTFLLSYFWPRTRIFTTLQQRWLDALSHRRSISLIFFFKGAKITELPFFSIPFICSLYKTWETIEWITWMTLREPQWQRSWLRVEGCRALAEFCNYRDTAGNRGNLPASGLGSSTLYFVEVSHSFHDTSESTWSFKLLSAGWISMIVSMDFSLYKLQVATVTRARP